MEALLALALYHRLDFVLAHQLAERVLAMAQEAKAPAMLAGAHYVLGAVLDVGGQFPATREHLERAVELFGAGPPRNYVVFFAPATSIHLVAALAVLGYPSTAHSRAHEWVAAARRSSDPYSIATVLAMNGMHHLLLRDTRMVMERADEILSIATEIEIPPHYSIYATFFSGLGYGRCGTRQGNREMRRTMSNPVPAEAFAEMLRQPGRDLGQKWTGGKRTRFGGRKVSR
jgi:hypothetical protein